MVLTSMQLNLFLMKKVEEYSLVGCNFLISTVKNTIFELRISKIQNKFSLKLRSNFTLENENSLLMKVGYGRKQIHLKVDHLDYIVIFSEWSSLECD